MADPSTSSFARLGGLAAVIGVVVLLISTFLHPMQAHPDDAPAAFAEYAADRAWVASHLGQLLGAMLICAGLVALACQLRSGRAGVWARWGAVGALASLAMSGALQAVDGVALKAMVDRWAAAGAEMKPMAFEAAFAVRQVEIGLAAVVNLFFGVTAMLFAAALWCATRRWLGALGAVGGVGTVLSGILQAYTGFSELAMTVGMPSNLLLLLWVLLVGRVLLRGGPDAAG